MISSALIARLKTVHPRVFQNIVRKHNRLPAITVDLDSSFRFRHFGTSNIQTGLIESDFEITVWGKEPGNVNGLAESVIANLENFSGPWVDGGSPQQTHSIAGIEITSEIVDFDGPTELYTYSIFVTITHTEA